MGFPTISLGEHKITLESGGIEIQPYTYSAQIKNGILTSTESFLEVRSNGHRQAEGSLYIEATIADSSHRVGVRFSGGSGILAFSGLYTNTFTGNVEILGAENQLHLSKTHGAVSVRGDILVEKGRLVFRREKQLLNTSSVTLKDKAYLIYDSNYNYSITNIFKNLVIEGGGTISFEHTQKGDNLYSKYYIYLNDLVISDRGPLTIRGWQEGRDFLLVRKTSTTLADALTKLTFVGYDPYNIHLEEFNSEYWSISGAPEPSTTGAILGAAGLCLWGWRKRKHCATYTYP